jgi:hypothetical protein
VAYPPPFSGLLNILNVFSFDFIKMDCLVQGSNYFSGIFLFAASPVMLCLVVVLVFVLRSIPIRFAMDARNKVQELWVQHFSVLLLITYVALPPVSM